MTAFAFAGSVFASNVEAEGTAIVGVSYRTHVQNEGWETKWATDGETAGTQGKGLRLEGIEIKLSGDDLPANGGIEYRTHVENEGWETQWAADGKTAGTQGKGLRLEGIQIRLVNMPSNYSVEYRTHVQNEGWETDWARDGESAGTEGKGLRLEGIEIKIIRNGSDLRAYQSALAAVIQADYTGSSWATYQGVVTANVVTENNLQSEVDAATAAITAAQKKLVKVSDMTAYYAALGAVKQADYTIASWTTYQGTVAANTVSEMDAPEKIIAATAAITAAQKNLIRVADMTAYTTAINAVNQAQVKSGWAEYKAVIDANMVTNQNSQAQVDAATAAIVAAQKKLVLYASMVEFDKAIALYLQYGPNSSAAPYSTETWNAYVDRCELYGTLTNGKWNYDVISKNNSQSTVDAATDYINVALENLVGGADLTAFNAAKAIKITDGPYTTASFNIYLTDPRVTAITELPIATLKAYSQEVINSYITILKALQEEILVLGSDLTAYNEALNNAKQANYTSVSWSAYQVVVAANVVTADKTQAQVDAATTAIVNAQKNLVYSGAYIAANANLDSAHFEVQGVGDNVITRAKELMTESGFNPAKYTITLTRIDNGTAVINATTGAITNIGSGSATVTFTITPTDESVSATTGNVVLVLK